MVKVNFCVYITNKEYHGTEIRWHYYVVQIKCLQSLMFIDETLSIANNFANTKSVHGESQSLTMYNT